MNYYLAREMIKTGDIAGVEGAGFFEVGIRVMTGQNLSHVAMFVWINGGLFIFEYTARGYSLSPASDWLKKRFKNKKAKVYWGIAPEKIHNGEQRLIDSIFKIRDDGNRHRRHYAFYELPIIWFAQIFDLHIERLSRVCSTSIAKLWSKAGYSFKETPDPGDFIAVCQRFSVLEI